MVVPSGARAGDLLWTLARRQQCVHVRVQSYIDNWDAKSKVVLRFTVRANGTLGPSTEFADFTGELLGEEALDGMEVNVDGNFRVTAPDGVRIDSAPASIWARSAAPRTRKICSGAAGTAGRYISRR